MALLSLEIGCKLPLTGTIVLALHETIPILLGPLQLYEVGAGLGTIDCEQACTKGKVCRRALSDAPDKGEYTTKTCQPETG